MAAKKVIPTPKISTDYSENKMYIYGIIRYNTENFFSGLIDV